MSQRSVPPAEKPKSTPLGTNTQTVNLVRQAFDDVAIVFGTVASNHSVLDDDLVWSIMRRLDRIRIRLLRDLTGIKNEPGSSRDLPPALRVHPALDGFLVRNRVGMGE